MSFPIEIKLQEWQKASFETDKRLLRVALPEDDATQKLLEALSKAEKLNVLQLSKGLIVETSSYVGKITLGELQVTIQPKISGMPLLQLLRYAYGLRQLELFADTGFDISASSFQDLLVYQLAAEVSELVQRGLQRRYVRREASLVSPRGRIAVEKIANQGGVAYASLPCTYYPRLEDCLMNQVLLQGVLLGSRLISKESETLKAQLLHLANFHLSNISSIRLNWSTIQRLRSEMNRLTTVYEPTIALIEMLLIGEGISFDEDQDELHLPGFLFDMNHFFQELLSRFLKEHLLEYTVQSQFVIEDMMAYVDNPQRHEAPRPRPDYVVKKGGKVVAILDAKYRDLWEKPLPPAMLYQLVIYALSQSSCNSATILYPTTSTTAQEARIEVRIPTHNTGRVYVVLRPVPLQKLAELISNSRSIANERQRVAFAQWMVFGDAQG